MAKQRTIETDGSFFDDLRSMERRILTERAILRHSPFSMPRMPRQIPKMTQTTNNFIAK